MRDEHRNEAIAMMAGFGLGAAVMYFLDPQRGNARRAELADRAGGKLRDARYDIEVARRDLRNRAQGAAAEMRGYMRDEFVEDEQLSERVRSEVGHHAGSIRGVDVIADDGRITLRGEIAAEDHADLVAAARGVRGVEEVRDELTDRSR